MADTSPTHTQQQVTAQLASARQLVALLQSQLKAGVVERDYWTARLEELSNLLEELAEERAASDQHRRMAALYEVSKVLGLSLDLTTVLNQVMDAIIQLTGAERGFLMLLGRDGDLEIRVARNMDRETLAEGDLAVSQSVIRLVAETGEQVLTTNAVTDPRFSGKTSIVAHNLRSILCVPLLARGEIIGVIYVDNRVRSGVFSQSDLETLATFAAQAAMVIENARLFTLTDKALARRVEELSRLQEIDRELNETLDFAEVMDRTLNWAVRMTNADNGAIGLIDVEQGQTRVVAQHGEAPAAVTAMLADSQAVSNGGSLTVPIQREGRVIGVIALDRKDGRSFDPEALALVTRMADHAAIAIENARLYEEVRRANQAKSEFVSVMTHELRVPMTSIKGYAEMLGMVGELNEQQKSFLEIIRNNIARMSVQVSDLSDISRIESGRLKLEIEEGVSLRQVLDDVLASIKAEIEKRQHTIVVDLPGELPSVRADPQRLTQVLTNLVNNAVKYTPDGGTITIRAWQVDSFVRCAVQDTGIGMEPEEVGRLFTKFWRSEDRFVREQPGTGLGLAIAKNLVEMQGGSMQVESQKGQGSTFSFTLPASK